eukprot:6458893-Amphidinium_carterae.1
MSKWEWSTAGPQHLARESGSLRLMEPTFLMRCHRSTVICRTGQGGTKHAFIYCLLFTVCNTVCNVCSVILRIGRVVRCRFCQMLESVKSAAWQTLHDGRTPWRTFMSTPCPK